jgi:hypothetical protein
VIEAALGVVLPEAYKNVMASFPWPAFRDSTEASLWDNPTAIVDQTKAQRAGFGGAPPWPAHYVMIGDESDACPYALDCKTGAIVQTDHGNLKNQPLATFHSVAELVAETTQAWEAGT